MPNNTVTQDNSLWCNDGNIFKPDNGLWCEHPRIKGALSTTWAVNNGYPERPLHITYSHVDYWDDPINECAEDWMIDVRTIDGELIGDGTILTRHNIMEFPDSAFTPRFDEDVCEAQ